MVKQIVRQLKALDASARFDLSQYNVIETMVKGMANELGITVPTDVLDTVTRLIIANVSKLNSIQGKPDATLIRQIGQVQKVAQGAIATGLYTMEGAVSGNSLLTKYTGTSLDREVQQTTVQPAETVPPTVVDVQFDSVESRSMIRSISVTFDEDVGKTINRDSMSISGTNPEGVNININSTMFTFNYSPDTLSGTWILNDGAFTGNSLPDGNYTIKIKASTVYDLAGNALDGNSDGTGGDDYVMQFHRYYGDLNGDRTLSATELGSIRNHYLQKSPNAQLDVNRDKIIDGQDMAQFRERYLNKPSLPLRKIAAAGIHTSISSSRANPTNQVFVNVCSWPDNCIQSTPMSMIYLLDLQITTADLFTIQGLDISVNEPWSHNVACY